VESVLLTARVVWEEGRYVASVDALSLEAVGDSVSQAQDELVIALRGWIEAQDTLGNLEESLARAGYVGVDEDTELQLEFVELGVTE
jgi:predicted RNase H-like HicB family nuclease